MTLVVQNLSVIHLINVKHLVIAAIMMSGSLMVIFYKLSKNVVSKQTDAAIDVLKSVTNFNSHTSSTRSDVSVRFHHKHHFLKIARQSDT